VVIQAVKTQTHRTARSKSAVSTTPVG
jgi:hypothetical protein